MNKTRCVHCGKELEYEGFCCPTMCDECNNKWLDSMGSIIYTQPVQEDYFFGSVKCLICGENVPIRCSEKQLTVKICESCKQAVMKMSKENKLTVYFDEVTRKNIYKLNGVDVTETMEIIKDKWEREIIDTKCKLFHLDMGVIREKDKRITELEEKLANAIVPKFKPHNDLFVIVGYKDEPKIIEQYYIDEIVVRGNGKYIEYRDIEKETIIGENNLLFSTLEEAEAKLKELQDEN